MTRFLKNFRALKTLKVCHQLRVLVFTMMNSFLALASSLLILFTLQVMGAFLMCEMLHDFIMDPSEDIDMREFAYARFGSAAKSTYTMFEITFAGNWPVTARPIIEKISAWYALFFLAYITLVVFAVIRIITALFLKETLQVATDDAEMMVQQRLKQKEAFAEKLRAVFAEADADGDGLVSLAEFKKILDFKSVKPYLSVLELDVQEGENIFHLLDDGDGHVSFDEFLEGVLRLKGSARSQDVVSLMHATHIVSDQVAAVRTELHGLQEQWSQILDVLPPVTANARVQEIDI